MKSILILILALFITSCCSTKKAIESNSKKPEDLSVKQEIPDTIEVDREEDEPYNNELNDTIVKLKVEKVVKADEIENDLNFHQDVSKREGPVHSFFDELLKKYVNKNGNVDYEGFKKSHGDLLGYISILQMMSPRLNEFSREEQLAYWINAYNALTIDLILRNYPTESIKDIKDPWDQRLWKFGDKWQNLNDIEHKILRKMNEPRIHFAIVCASVSCPKLYNEAFTATHLDEQLTKVTKDFLTDISKNELSKDRIKLSKIFKWFKKDFEQNGSLIDFLNTYSDVTISSDAKKSYKDYNWNLND